MTCKEGQICHDLQRRTSQRVSDAFVGDFEQSLYDFTKNSGALLGDFECCTKFMEIFSLM